MQTYHYLFAARLDERRMRKEAVEAFLKPPIQVSQPAPAPAPCPCDPQGAHPTTARGGGSIMSDEFEYEPEFREAQRFPVSDYHSELARRKARREAVADDLAHQRTQRRIAEDRENEKWCRPLTGRDVEIFDRYQSYTHSQNARTSRELRDRDRLLKKLDAFMERDHATYMERFADKHAALQGIPATKYKGN